MIKYKKCDCDEDYWEEIVVNKDENYELLTTLYFHCSCCGVDFRIEDFESGKQLEYKTIETSESE